MPTNAELIAAIDDVLITTLSLVRDLNETDADRPTDCPGWTVRDQLAHMVGLEQVLAGAPQPDIDLPTGDHVRNEMGEMMERQIEIRRRLPLVAIADELAGFRPRRIEDLKRLARLGDPEVPGPFGERPLSVSLPIRVLDLWAHEQDIRRAVGLRPRTACAAADLVLGRALDAWSAILPKRLGDVGGDLTVTVTDRELPSRVVDLGPGDTAAALVGDTADLTAWFCGRGVPGDAALTGDAALVEAVRPALAATP